MELLDNYYNELCDLIYNIPLEKNGWFNFSKRLLDVLDVSYVHIQAIDFTYNVLSFSNGVGVFPLENYAAAELDYLRYPIEADPRWGKFLDPDRKGWYQCHTHVTNEFVQKSDLYQKILLPIDLRYVATHELLWDDKLCVFWSISTSEQREPLNADELEFLDRLMPHLKRIMLVKRELFEFSVENIVGYNLIDKLSQPIILLNMSGQIVHYNQASDQLLKDNNYILAKDNKLILPRDDQVKLSDHLYKIEEMFRYNQEQLNSCKDTLFSISNSDLKITLSLLASEKEMSFFGIRPLVMLSFEKNAGKLTKDKRSAHYQLLNDDLKEKYKLTKRELELCHMFVNGMNLKQIGQQMELTRSSIRTYLRNIFTKTECNSQAELMHFLIGLSSDFQ
ncbi:LuxR C-terminal-related transcriptional regulator [Acinetobacter baumannii]|uniref:helix-turn-helix transcriptional regulator n=1 Tax=Acinetobacter baumannii TaxID=470 RepID=UPI00112C6954|nr:LuxR C-terminal-related transcriptional regulator [Acinetobacter baumannii]MDC4400071.1 LuxR C-terminal-related transcriptional regulator [Acinetobacter baumannii]MDC5301048.1 LuxR C-terminal-related transcriptional regulator [Acinetobacter baumannii]MDV7640491.1 LuxR C-terminal-related transcriptional regulator [Acinetobacter baumannii]TPT05454.1 response regulator transcription factor [Acinetobacter baumannii]